MSFQFKTRTQDLDFLKISYYAYSILITHFLKLKHQNAHVSLFRASWKFSQTSKHVYITCPTLLKKLISTPENDN